MMTRSGTVLHGLPGARAPVVELPDAESVSAGEPPLTIALFGGFALSCCGRPIVLKSRKAQALVAYLALSGTASESRERLCGLLWSESCEDKARASLRQALHGLREELEEAGCPAFRVGRDSVALDTDKVEIDAAALLASVGRGRIHPALLARKRLADGLLAGFDDIDPAFRVWLLVQRQSLQEQLVRTLEALLAQETSPSDRVRDTATALLNLDPTHEEACRRLMRDYVESGDVAAALKTYKRLWELLDEEYGTEPSERTQALVVSIKNNELAAASAEDRSRSSSDAPAPSEPSAPPDDHTFLILSPFDSRGVSEALLHLVQGLRHELIAKLVRFREWSVLDGSGASCDMAGGSARCFSIDATLRQASAALSLTLTIKEQPSGRYIWSESFALDIERWFELQQSLVRRIATAVNVHLSTERLMLLARRPAISLGSYDRWLRGQQHYLTWRASDLPRAAAAFRSIIEEAPLFSPAYSGLVQLKNSEHLILPGLPRRVETAQEALALAKTAVQTDPFDSRAQLCLAWSFAMNGQFAQAEANFDLALQLNDNDPWTITSAALGKAFCGKHDAAIDLADQALWLNLKPSRSHWAYQATLRFVCGDYAGCVDAAEKAQEAILNIPGWHAAALGQLGSLAEARAMGRHFVDLIAANWRAEGPATEEAVAGWFLRCFPVRLRSDWTRLRDGLALAGLRLPLDLVGAEARPHPHCAIV